MTLTERLNAYEKLIRLDKPIGILLLLWPTLWGLWLSSRGMPDWTVVWIFVLGTVLMRSAGCAINDYADRNIDPHVERTRERPLATGQISAKEAIGVAVVLAGLAFLLVLQLNRLTIMLAVVAAFLAATYPFTKHFLALPQAYLGLAFGFGIPMAFAAQTGKVPGAAWWLLTANVFWTMAYDTQYAMVDREDDRKLGIRTSALLFGDRDVAMVMLFHGLFFVTLAYIGWRYGLGVYYFFGIGFAAALAASQYLLIRERTREGCFRAFRHNNWVGAMVFAALIAEFSFPPLR
ncbi:MAG TPA: 4-hydroxybenzoate octaprenyltransferase [Burkholderiales bacterium]|nr:4-hydroxybenzoate octaprenyltransferase [Burkholderiales bacterium]